VLAEVAVTTTTCGVGVGGTAVSVGTGLGGCVATTGTKTVAMTTCAVGGGAAVGVTDVKAPQPLNTNASTRIKIFFIFFLLSII
jgi:hypothetical protein